MSTLGTIRVLPRLVIDQIAAGEVVERPASVVRELVDNALDSGATQVDVEIEEGGRTRIRVGDDGCGIPFEELPLAFASHATSKLRAIDDLDHVATLGFRGEALASIGAISRARVRSATEGARHAGEIEDEGGAISEPHPAARSRGTDVEVLDLFYNVPARRRFLKRDATEAGHAVDVVVRQALARPEVGFRVRVDGNVRFEAPAASVSAEGGTPFMAARLERIRRAFGDEVADDLRELREVAHNVQIEGFLGGTASARSDASGVHLFVNGRFVRDRAVLAVLREATRDVLGARQPFAVLFVSLDPALVDVNVHPAKLEVRFRMQADVTAAIHRAVRRVLEGRRPAEPGSALLGLRPRGAPSSFAWAREPEIVRETPYLDQAPMAQPSMASPAPVRSPAAAAEPARLLSTAAIAAARSARFLRINDTFLAVESVAGLELLDQHALHERVNFERLKTQQISGGIARQRLLVPIVIDLPAGDLALSEEAAPRWRDLGLEVDRFGPASIAVRSVPAGLKHLRVQDLVADLLSLEREGRRAEPASLLEDALHRCACRASVMAGDRLSDDEIIELLQQAAALPADQTCPHGRPTRILLSLRELERAFERG